LYEVSFSSLPLTYKLLPKVLDLRERGSETESESVGTAAFTNKSLQQDSPFTPPGRPHKARIGYGRTRNEFNTFSSNIMLTTLGSIPPDPDILEQDLAEVDNVRFGPNTDMHSLGGTGGEDGEDVPDGERHPNGTPTPTYHSLEIGFRPGSSRPSHEDLRAIQKPTPTYHPLEIGFKPGSSRPSHEDLKPIQNRADVDHGPSIV